MKNKNNVYDCFNSKSFHLHSGCLLSWRCRTDRNFHHSVKRSTLDPPGLHWSADSKRQSRAEKVTHDVVTDCFLQIATMTITIHVGRPLVLLHTYNSLFFSPFRPSNADDSDLLPPLTGKVNNNNIHHHHRSKPLVIPAKWLPFDFCVNGKVMWTVRANDQLPRSSIPVFMVNNPASVAFVPLPCLVSSCSTVSHDRSLWSFGWKGILWDRVAREIDM